MRRDHGWPVWLGVRREHSAVPSHGGKEGRGNQLHSNYLVTSAMGCG